LIKIHENIRKKKVNPSNKFSFDHQQWEEKEEEEVFHSTVNKKSA
jgi:hypothetical protein